ncbi:NAD(P)H-hydrate epimerase [Puccinia sorghi]|uniref:NAD(P)H-hydrate epimerase n=1 Tax=Puccinia sorghi TaxID=27349 RepID=A0A0L6V322_9BASI|nr:NAD(P)H-hydrate epimerase [Puccinia sorghi]
MTSYLTRKEAQEIDALLMGPQYGYTLVQLMELAGLACAQALHKAFPPGTHPRVLVCCGPGNQGGDALVAARHLWHFGYRPTLYYPKQTDKQHYKSLLQQCEALGMVVITGSLEEMRQAILERADVIMDGIFGFSFHGEPRAPFDEPIRLFKETGAPIVSIDIPSGWDVEAGNPHNRYFSPQLLVSLTAPKHGVRSFPGRHFLGGRFLPPLVAPYYDS